MAITRSTRRAVVSLFSFQDIITSVTAIMILLVLILTLELVTRSQRRGVTPEDRQVARELRETVDALRSRADVLRAEQAGATQAARRVAAVSVAEIRRRQDEADRTVGLLQEENAILEARARTARVDQRTAERRLVDGTVDGAANLATHAVAMDQRAAEMEEANRRERERQHESHRTAARPAGGTLVFNQDPDNARTPVLVDASADGLTVLAGGGPPRQYSWSGERPAADFGRWLSTLDSESRYVVVLLRPSAVNRYDKVREAVTAAGLGLGLELVGESMRVVLPANGSDG
jgi:hypothetical protein